MIASFNSKACKNRFDYQYFVYKLINRFFGCFPEALEKTFDAYGFVVERYDDVKGTEMIHIIEDTARKNHSAYDCFVCCILSHGNLGLVCGSDGVAVEIKDLTAAVKPARCPSLTGKPKIFIMQACQGSNIQYGMYTKLA